MQLAACRWQQTDSWALRPELPIHSGRVGGTKKWGGPLRAHAGWLRAQRPLPPLSEGRCISSRRQLEAANLTGNAGQLAESHGLAGVQGGPDTQVLVEKLQELAEFFLVHQNDLVRFSYVQILNVFIAFNY